MLSLVVQVVAFGVIVWWLAWSLWQLEGVRAAYFRWWDEAFPASWEDD